MRVEDSMIHLKTETNEYFGKWQQSSLVPTFEGHPVLT